MDVQLIAVCAIVFLGATVQGAIGFGLAVIVTPLLFLLDPSWVPQPIILMGLALSIFTLLRMRAPLQIGVLAPALLGRIPGGILGTYLLIIAPQQWLGLAIGLIVLCAVGLTIQHYSIPFNRYSLFAAGTLSGMFSAISAIGGPPMALLLNNHQSVAQTRQTLSAFFLLGSLIALMLLAIAGKLNLADLYKGLWLLPPTALGFWLGDQLANKIEPEKLKQMTLLLCASSGLILVVQSLFFW